MLLKRLPDGVRSSNIFLTCQANFSEMKNFFRGLCRSLVRPWSGASRACFGRLMVMGPGKNRLHSEGNGLGGDDRPAGEKGSLVRMGLGGEASCGRRAEPLPSRGSEVVEMTFQNDPRVVSSWKVCASKEEALSWMRGVVTPSSWKVCASLDAGILDFFDRVVTPSSWKVCASMTWSSSRARPKQS